MKKVNFIKTNNRHDVEETSVLEEPSINELEDSVKDIDAFGFKTTTGGKQYCLYNFINDINLNIEEEYKNLTKDYSGQDAKYTSASLSYRNKDGIYEATPFDDRAIGFIINDNYDIYESYKMNTVSEGNPLPLDQNNRITERSHVNDMAKGVKNYVDNKLSNEENEINFLKHLSNSDRRWKQIIKKFIIKYKYLVEEINKINEKLNKLDRSVKKEEYESLYRKCNQLIAQKECLFDSFYAAEGIQEILRHHYPNKAKDPNNNCRFLKAKMCRDKRRGPYNKLEISANNGRIVVNGDIKNILEEQYNVKITNNELLIKNQPGKTLNINSLLINLECHTENLKILASRMQEIVDFQLSHFDHIQIPVRGEDKKINIKYLWEFVEQVKDICDEREIELPKDYPTKDKVIEQCNKHFEDKIQNKINEIFKKEKKCHFRDGNHKLLNERAKIFKHSEFIKEINKYYYEIQKYANDNRDFKDIYCNCLQNLYKEGIDDILKKIQNKNNDKKDINNTSTNQNNLNNVRRPKNKYACCGG